MFTSICESFADALCRNCPMREKQRGGKCQYLDEVYEHCYSWKKVKENENELLISIANLVKFQTQRI